MADPTTRVVVVGSGPAGLYAAEELSKAEIAVDVLDRLPCPYGLLRYGVAPDHLKMKNLEITLRKTLERPEVRFLGGAELGRDVSVEELHEFYDAIVYATGSSVDRHLGVPGEDLPGSFSATEFVSWYSGHPDADIDQFTLDATGVVVIGVGNVAVDVVRVMAKTATEMRETDVPDHVLEVLEASKITDIHMVGRRGPVQAKFTTKELRELGELANADIIVRSDELELDEASEVALEGDKSLRKNLEVIRGWADREPTGKPRRIHLRFLHSPVEILGSDRVSGVRLERNALNGRGGVAGTGSSVDVDAQMVLRSVGYRGTALPGVPFDDRDCVIPNEAGRVMVDGSHVPGEYVAGWIKRGPTGVIGTNRSDAKETIGCLLEDLDSLPRSGADPDAIIEHLRRRDVPVVTWEGWQAIDEAEKALGARDDRTRVKIHDLQDLFDAAKAAGLT